MRIVDDEYALPAPELLNAFEQASQSDEPAKNGYAAKRNLLYAYVRELERLAAIGRKALAASDTERGETT
jgi:hypothetical protein